MSLSVRLRHRLGRFTLDAAFDAPAGVTVLFGRSGAGKSTIVNAVAGLLHPDDGRVAIGDRVLVDTDAGTHVPPHMRRIGTIFQEGRLFPHLTVAQNLRYGTRRAPRGATPPSFDRIVEMLGIGPLLSRRPAALSGGEKQRVAIGRALLSAPSLILADEPLASLDDARKEEILPYFEKLRDDADVPILYVSHSAGEVARLATTIVALADGKVMRQGPAADVLSDPDVMPTGVRDVGAVLVAEVTAHHADGLSELTAGGATLTLPDVGRTVGTRVRVRIAAHDVILSLSRPDGVSALNILSGTIEAIRPGTGLGVIVALRTPAGRVLSRITRRSAEALALREGLACYAMIKTVAVAPGDVGAAGSD